MKPGFIQITIGIAALFAVGLFLSTRTKVNLVDAISNSKNAAGAGQPDGSDDPRDKPSTQKYSNKIDLLENVDLENVERTDVGGSRSYISPPTRRANKP